MVLNEIDLSTLPFPYALSIDSTFLMVDYHG